MRASDVYSLTGIARPIERVEKHGKTDANFEDLGRVLRGLKQNGELNVKSLGWWFRRNATVVVGGRQFVPVSQNSAREKVYRLLRVEGSSSSLNDRDETNIDFFADL